MSVAPTKKPLGLHWRSSVWYVTFIVGLGVMVDLLVYSIVIPVLPFHLEELGYENVSGLVGWLLFAYSAGLVISTPPIAMLSERYNTRTWPLVFGQIILIGSQVMLMEAPTYWLMVLARVIQGISSSIIWVLGLALVCDTASESIVGRQLGIAMIGLSLGVLIGPLVGGVLYSRFGFHGPGILAIIVTAVDLIGRLLIIERKDALKHGVDPAAIGSKEEQTTLDPEKTDGNEAEAAPAAAPTGEEGVYNQTDERPADAAELANKPRLSLLAVVGKFARSPRALAIMFCTLLYGVVYAAQEPALPLHLQAVYNFNSSKVGLVYLAGVIPTLFSSPVSGWLTDRKGPEWVIPISVLLALPWFALLVLEVNLAFFIAMFCIENLFLAAVVPPLTGEFALVSRNHDGVGYAHVYGAFNLSYGIGSALGPVIGGQMYDHIRQGWTAVCLFSVGLLAITAVVSAIFTGDKPLLTRFHFKRRPLEI